MENLKTREIGEHATIKELGSYEIGEFVLYHGNYDLPLPPLRNAYDGMFRKDIFTLAEALKTFESEGYRVASVEEVAQARIEGGIDSGVCLGGMTKEALICFPKKRLLMMTKNSPLLKNIEAIHKEENEDAYLHGHLYEPFSVSDECLNGSVELHLEEVVRDKYSYKIPTKNFEEQEMSKFLFGKTAKEYRSFLEKTGFDHVGIRDASCALKIVQDGIITPPTVTQFGFNWINFQKEAGMDVGGNFYHDPGMFFIKPGDK